MPDLEQMIGQILLDTYRVERLIGEGGMGAVYEASHLRLARRFAIKLLFAKGAKDRAALARFQREAEVTSALGHPHILDVIDFNSTLDGTPFIIMELLEGENLSTRLARLGRMGLAQAGSILRQTASALQAAHDKGVIHRDLKPHNIFLCRRGERSDFVKVVDFGVSKVASSQSLLTSSQALIGTPVYMSPEQAEQKVAHLDFRSDIYSLGVVLFEMLSGKPPFAAESIPQLLFKIAYHEPPQLSSLRPDLPAAVERVVARAMAKKPSERFNSALELWQAFAAAASQAIELETSFEGGVSGDWVPPTEDRGTDWVSRRSRPATPPGLVTTLTSGTGELHAISERGRGRRKILLVSAGVLALVVVGAGVLLLHPWKHRSGPERSERALPTPGRAPQSLPPPDTRASALGVRDAGSTQTAKAARDGGTAGTLVAREVPERPRLKPRRKPAAKKKRRLGDDIVDRFQ